MLFNSIEFAFFFAIVTTLYFLIPHRCRWALLLAASSIFYMAFVPVYILILFFTIGVDYVAGLKIESGEEPSRKRWLIASLTANLSVLAVFKYFNFFVDNAAWLTSGWLNVRIPRLDLVLPIGLSFHTFQAMAYTIEIYRRHVKAERHLGYFALYVMYYPQLVAGPIERPQNLLPQLRAEHGFDYARVVSGLIRMAIGLFKKMVIADQLALVVESVYEKPTQFHGLSLIVAALFFTVEAYCDFSGYSDVALGAAEVMGVNLMKNFRSPLTARSLADMWRRWHISLTTWFRDYVYIPLGGNRGSRLRKSFNVLFVFALSGLWHGAQWTYVLFGVLSGVMVVAGELTASMRARMSGGWARNTPLSTVATFLLFTFSLILFRARSLANAWYIMSHLHVGLRADLENLWTGGEVLSFSALSLLAVFGALALLLKVDAIDASSRATDYLRAAPPALRWAMYLFLVYSSLIAASFHREQQYMYFQF